MELDFEKPLIELDAELAELQALNKDPKVNFDTEIAALLDKRVAVSRAVYANLTPWQTVQIARHPERPLARDFLAGMCSDFIELHGDRCYGDDPGILGGLATLHKHRVMLIAHQKGRGVEANVACNFGMANPEGYRKALRLMKLAAKYGLPVVCLIDTPGAYPGLEAEARGQAEAIARNLTEMSLLPVPIVVVVTGEGGSGGALGIGVGDVLLMLKYAVYSVISPEGCASILWRDGAKAPEAAAALKLTAAALLDLGIADGIIPEPEGGAHRHRDAAIDATAEAVVTQLRRLKRLSPRSLLQQRHAKYGAIGRVKKSRPSSSNANARKT